MPVHARAATTPAEPVPRVFSAAYFSHAFRRHFGLSASEIRRSSATASF